MGLDMYLERRHYVQRWDHIPADRQFAVSVTRGGKPYLGIKPELVSYVTEQAAYWRKANQIHQWFVENVQSGTDDCRDYYVPREKLVELVALCEQVLAGQADGSKVLPTTSGFFFGSTEYDDEYRDDLKSTVRQLRRLLAEEDNEGDFYYRASW